MVLIKLGLPAQENIVSRNKFVVNKIFPIAIRATVVPDQYIILFIAHQDYDESYLYFQMMVKVDNAFEQTYLESHQLNIKHLQMKDNKSIEAYQKLISQITDSNVYATDFDMVEDVEYPLYYKTTCIRAIDKTHASVVDVYFTLDNFIKIKIYLTKFTTASSVASTKLHEEIFSNPKYHNIELVNIETVKMDCTKVEPSHYESMNLYTTHYTMNCGPSCYLMNWIVIEQKDQILKIPLDSNLYDSFYKFHYNIINVFLQEDYLYILYIENSEIDGSYKKTKVLRLNKELTDKTNFKDSANIFIKKENK